jgi:nucleoside-diphosphate-sugar epimerase
VIPTYHSLLTTTINVLQTATEFGCARIVLSGSFTEPQPGQGEPIPGSPYAAAKWAGSAYARMFHALYQAPTVILRPFMTYGPRQASDKLIPAVTTALLTGVTPRLSSGRTKADWVYIADVVDAFVLAAQIQGLEGSSIDLGTGQLVPVRTVVEHLAGLIDSDAAPLFGALPDRPAENEIAANTVTASEKLGWRAATPLEVGLRMTVEWHRAEISDVAAPHP